MSRDRRVAVGMEIGGGQTTVALIDERGQVRLRYQAKTLRGRPLAATLEPYLRAIETLLASAQAAGWRVDGIGVSVPGSVDPQTRRPQVVPMLPVLNNFPLCELLHTRYDLPTALHADVEAAVLGEHRFGAGRGRRSLLFLTVNAVVGAAMITDGQLVHSAQQAIGHVCHLPLAPSGPRCSCGKRGCVNTLVSLDAMQRMVQRVLRRGEETSLLRRLLNREAFSLRLLAEEAEQGDAVAAQIYNEIVRWLGAAISKYIDLFEPDLLILGGYALDVESEALLAQVRVSQAAGVLNGTTGSYTLTRGWSPVEIVPARLGRDAALVGAAAPLLRRAANP